MKEPDFNGLKYAQDKRSGRDALILAGMVGIVAVVLMWLWG